MAAHSCLQEDLVYSQSWLGKWYYNSRSKKGKRKNEGTDFSKSDRREPPLWFNWNENGCSFIAMVG